jgi:putative transposase
LQFTVFKVKINTMARIARVVLPGIPHLITQRGNHGQPVFFSDKDYQTYLSLMAEWCEHRSVKIWAYCLMPNHTHLIAVPAYETGLRLSIGEAHRRYTRHINFSKQWRGHLWQERFSSFPMDEYYLMAAARFVELNPVRAGLVNKAEDYPWSSAKPHLLRKKDALVKTKPLLKLVDNWPLFLEDDLTDEDLEKIRLHERTGRPLGNDKFITMAEEKTKRRLRPLPPGPKPKK